MRGIHRWPEPLQMAGNAENISVPWRHPFPLVVTTTSATTECNKTYGRYIGSVYVSATPGALWNVPTAVSSDIVPANQPLCWASSSPVLPSSGRSSPSIQFKWITLPARYWPMSVSHSEAFWTGIILCVRPANQRRRYDVSHWPGACTKWCLQVSPWICHDMGSLPLFLEEFTGHR